MSTAVVGSSVTASTSASGGAERYVRSVGSFEGPSEVNRIASSAPPARALGSAEVQRHIRSVGPSSPTIISSDVRQFSSATVPIAAESVEVHRYSRSKGIQGIMEGATQPRRIVTNGVSLPGAHEVHHTVAGVDGPRYVRSPGIAGLSNGLAEGRLIHASGQHVHSAHSADPLRYVRSSSLSTGAREVHRNVSSPLQGPGGADVQRYVRSFGSSPTSLVGAGSFSRVNSGVLVDRNVSLGSGKVRRSQTPSSAAYTIGTSSAVNRQVVGYEGAVRTVSDTSSRSSVMTPLSAPQRLVGGSFESKVETVQVAREVKAADATKPAAAPAQTVSAK